MKKTSCICIICQQLLLFIKKNWTFWNVKKWNKSKRESRNRREGHWPVRARLNMKKEQSTTHQQREQDPDIWEVMSKLWPWQFQKEGLWSNIPRSVSDGFWGQWGGEVSKSIPIMKSPEMQKLKEKWRTSYKKQKLLLKLFFTILC